MIELSYITKDDNYKRFKEYFIAGKLIGEDKNYYYVRNKKGSIQEIEKKSLTYMRIREVGE